MSFWDGRKVLVAGGAGFLGSHIAELLVEENAEVTIADNLERGVRRNLESVVHRSKLVETDLRSFRSAAAAVRGHDTILNFAAKVAGVTYNHTHHSEILLDNLLISSALLKAAVDARVERYLVLSSSAVYPYDSPIPVPEQEANKKSFGSGEEGYSWSKYVGELQARYCASESSMKVAIVRPFNVYGPRDPADGAKAHVIPAIIDRALRGGDELVVAGSGSQTRSFLYAIDAVQAILRVVERYAEADPVNIGSSREISIKELVQLILTLLGRPMRVRYDTSLPEGSPRKRPDLRKFIELFGETPEKVPLERGLEETVQWYCKQHPSSAAPL